MTNQNVFAAFEEDEVVAEIKNIKTHLLMLIVSKVRELGISQIKVSEITGITQPRVSNMMKGYLHKFSVDMLLTVLLKLDARPVVCIALGEDEDEAGASCVSLHLWI